jgi:hypothetical protein
MAKVVQWKGRRRPNPIKRKPSKVTWSDAERDPEMLFLIERTNLDPRSVAAIARESYLSPGTIHAALDGDTRRPQNSTLTLWAAAIGLKRAFVSDDGTVHVVKPWHARIDAMKKQLKTMKRRAAALRI